MISLVVVPCIHHKGNTGKELKKFNIILSQYVLSLFSVENSIDGWVEIARFSKSIAVVEVHESLVPWRFLEIIQG